MKNRIKLIILHIDLSTTNIQCLIDDKNSGIDSIPSLYLKNADILSKLQSLASLYLHTKPDWLHFNIVDIISDIEENCINIIYMVLIPITVSNKLGQWINVGEIEDEVVKTIVYKSTQKIAVGRGNYFSDN